MRERFSRSMTKHLVEEFTLNITIKHEAAPAYAVPVIMSAYELLLVIASAIDTILAYLKGICRPSKRSNLRLMPYIYELDEALIVFAEVWNF